jgi:hypothetical protein
MTRNTNSTKSILLPAVALGASFFYLDALRHYRRDDWLRADSLQWIGLGLGLVLYVLIVALVAVALGFVFKGAKSSVAALGVAGVCVVALLAMVTEARASFIPILCTTLGLFLLFLKYETC